MELAELIRALTDPAAYPFPVDSVEVRQTHISVVLLAGSWVYKIKKPVALGFVDFSTLALRRHFCQEEVRLNRRLAGDVYQGVVPLAGRDGGLAIEGAGPVVEWAVKMKRLPDEATLEHRLAAGDVGPEVLERLARKIAAFHAAADRSERIAEFGRFEVVARNARENFEQSRSHVGTTVDRRVFERLQALNEDELARHQRLIDARAARGVPCDTHGDLRLDHVYLLADRQPPDEMLILDCVEFNERFRFADPAADMAFLVMELKAAGRRDLAATFADAYFVASRDAEGRALMPFYVAYRAAVRGKVEGIKLAEREVTASERAAALAKTHGCWLLALGELERPERRPCLILIGGLPGTGKSTLAVDLAASGGFESIRSDLVRKELAGGAASGASARFGEGLYTPEWNERTYAECLRRVEQLFFEGRRVIVDASFRDDAMRRRFLDAGRAWGVPALCVICQAEPAAVRQRLASRRGDPSDADWSIYLRAAELWQQPGADVTACLHLVNTGGTRQQSLASARAVLGRAGLIEVDFQC